MYAQDDKVKYGQDDRIYRVAAQRDGFLWLVAEGRRPVTASVLAVTRHSDRFEVGKVYRRDSSHGPALRYEITHAEERADEYIAFGWQWAEGERTTTETWSVRGERPVAWKEVD